MDFLQHTVSEDIIKEYKKILLKLKIINIIVESNKNLSYHEQVYNSMRNENMYMLVIENMCLGIIMTKQTAFQFDYIKDIVDKYQSVKTLSRYKINIITIDKNWDTKHWSQKKLLNFYKGMMPSCDGRTMEQIKRDPYVNRMNEVDTNFLEALSWKSPYIDDTYYLRVDCSGNFTVYEPEPVVYHINE